MTTVYLIRHGEAEGNLYRRAQGQYNSGLTPLGRRQLAALAERFRDVPLDGVYSSDLSRAMETGAAICRGKSLPLHTDVRLREIKMGPWEDQPFGNLWADHPNEMTLFNHDLRRWRVEGADTLEALSARAVAGITDAARAHEGGSVAVCGHGYMINAVLCRLFYGLDNWTEAGRSTNTAVSKLLWDGDKFTLVWRHDASHLTEELLSHIAVNMVIRPMGETAAEEYIRYRRDAWQVVYGSLTGFDGPGFWLDAQRTVGDDPQAMVVGYLEGRPAGMLQLNPSREAEHGVGYIPFFYLREPYRDQGLGVQLLGHAVSFYRRLGRTKLQLSVYPGNARALAFYRKHGFVQVKKQRGRFGRLLLMEKDIAPPGLPAGVEILRV